MQNAAAIDAALDACWTWNALGGEVREVPHARFVRNTSFADLPGAERVSHVTASSPQEIDDLRALIDASFAADAPHTIDVDHRTPPAFEARLVIDGYTRRDSLVMLLEGDLRDMERGRPRPHPPSALHVPVPLQRAAPGATLEIREITAEQEWAAWEELCIADNIGYPVRPGVAADRGQAARLTASRRAKCPPVRYFLAFDGGEPAGFFSAWEGIGGVGVTENLSVAESARHRGIATALLYACVADARARGARNIALTCNPNDWPKDWYARLGFTAVALKRTYSP